MVQRHTHCNTSYCFRKKSNETELKCRFHFPFDLCPKTRFEFERIHTSGDNEHYRAKIVTKRRDFLNMRGKTGLLNCFLHEVQTIWCKYGD